MKYPRRSTSADMPSTADVDTAERSAAGAKGRPTPKRRDAQGRRGPVTAPRTRKEAYARQKQLTKDNKVYAATAKPNTPAERRAAARRGDPGSLRRQDQGNTRKLARDYVDSRRMLANYMLLLFPVFVAVSFVPALHAAEFVVLLLLIGFAIDCMRHARQVRTRAIERFGESQGSTASLGMYMLQRAYLPRKWRLPAPQVALGEKF